MPKMVIPRDREIGRLRDESHAKPWAKHVHDHREEIEVLRVDEDLVDELINALQSVPYVNMDWDIRPDHELAQRLAGFAKFLHGHPSDAYSCDFSGDSHYIKSFGQINSAVRLFRQQNVYVYAKLYTTYESGRFPVKASLAEEKSLFLPCEKSRLSVVFSHECEVSLRLQLVDDESLAEAFALAFLFNRDAAIQQTLIDRVVAAPESTLRYKLGCNPIYLEEFAKFWATASDIRDEAELKRLPSLVPEFIAGSKLS